MEKQKGRMDRSMPSSSMIPALVIMVSIITNPLNTTTLFLQTRSPWTLMHRTLLLITEVHFIQLQQVSVL